MSDEVNSEITPVKKFKMNKTASNSNGESSLENMRGETNVINEGSGSVFSNINSSNSGWQFGHVNQLNVNQGANFTRPPIARTLLHNDSCLPSPWFSGREDYLKKLKGAVEETQNRDAKFHFVTISGLWGMGKSQVARKFLANYKEDEKKSDVNIFWINASSGERMIKSFLRLADHFNIDTDKLKLGQDQGQGQGQSHSQGQFQEHTENVKKLVKDIYAHFDAHVGEGFFIFDGAKQFASSSNEFGVSIFLPNRETFKRIPTVIVTSRSQDWPKQCQILPLGPLDTCDSAELVKKAFAISNAENCTNYPQSLGPLSRLFDGFPLVLAQVSSKISHIMETAHGPNWNENWPYNHGPKNMLNTKLEDEIKKFMTKWEGQSPLTLLSAQELPDAPSHREHDPYDKYVPELWEAELEHLVDKGSENLYHKMALELLRLMSYLPENRISVKLLYFFFNVLPINSQSIQSLTSTSFDDINLSLGLLAKRSLITLDKSESECSGQMTHYAFYHEDYVPKSLGHLKFYDFFLGNNCGKIIILPLIQKLMQCTLKKEDNFGFGFQPLLKIVDFYLKNTKFCHQTFYNWLFFFHLKESIWPSRSYIAELYRILYGENSLCSNVIFCHESPIEKLQQIYLRLNKRGKKSPEDSMYLQVCRLAIIFLGHQNQLTSIKTTDFSTILNNSNLLPDESEKNSITIEIFLKSIVDLMMNFQDNFLVWFCGGQMLRLLNSRKDVNVNANVSAISHSGDSDYDVNDESFGDKKEKIITEKVWESVLLGASLKEKIGKLVNLYFKCPSKNRKKRAMTEKDVELAKVMIEATGHLFDLPVFKKVLMNVQFLDVYLKGGEGECECDEVKFRIWKNFAQNMQSISIWSSWTPQNEENYYIRNYDMENSFKIKKYFLDIKGVKILESSFLWFAKMLRKYQCVQDNFGNVMISVFEMLQELCFDPPLREQLLESESFISSFEQLLSAFMPMYFADKENVVQQFAALFSCAVSCLALSLPLPTRKKSKACLSKAKHKEEQVLENNYQKLRSLEGKFFWKYKSWSQDIPHFQEKVKETIRRTTTRSQVILEKVKQTRRQAENFQEDDLKTAQILMNVCLDGPTDKQE